MRSSSILSILSLSTLTAACAVPTGDSNDPNAAPTAAAGEKVGKAVSADTNQDIAVCSQTAGSWTYYTMGSIDHSWAGATGYPCSPSGSLVEDVSMEGTLPIYTNNAANHAVWVTIYDVAETQHLDYGCVSARSSRRWASGNYTWGSFYHVRTEVKANSDCTGDTLFDTSIEINPNATLYTSFGGMTGLAYDLIVNLVDYGSGYYLATGNSQAGPAAEFNGAVSVDPGPFLFWSEVDGVSQVLAPNPNCTDGSCGVVIEPYTVDATNEQWTQGWGDHGPTYTNVQSSMVLVPPTSQGATITLYSQNFVGFLKALGAAPSYMTWTIGGDFWNGFALRPLSNSDLNLNVLGNGPYNAGNAVSIWSWAGGAPNEVWKATHVPTYEGCFIDEGTRALPTQLMSGGATLGSCLSAAKHAGLTYAGLQDGGECWAGNADGSVYGKVADSQCNMPCWSATNEKCGNAWRNSVYAIR
jgi:hypothetical protein